MKLKLDENIGRRGLELLSASGHDVMTVRDQGLRGISDERLFEICAADCVQFASGRFQPLGAIGAGAVICLSGLPAHERVPR